jgi:CheY-specific phosphatase CheX
MDLDINSPRILHEAACEIFETMVFMDVSRCPESDAEVAPGVLSRVSFSGNFQGSLTMICSKECALAITMNLLALDDPSEVEDSDIPDTMGEIANMTMGAVKSRLYEKMGELSVSVPSVFCGDNMTPLLCENEQVGKAYITIDDEHQMQLHFNYFTPKD